MTMRLRSKFHRIFFALMIVSFASSSEVWAAQENPSGVSPEELKKRYIPQKSPDESYHLELELLVQGIYCYDLPLFDSAWRRKGNEVIASPLFKDTVAQVNKPFKAYIKGKYAVIYYPENRALGPVFFYKDKDRWVIDRTETSGKVFYGKTNWVILEGRSPYFSLVSQIFEMERIEITQGVYGYQPLKDSPLKIPHESF